MARQLHGAAITIIVLLGLVATVPTPVAASDEYVDSCSEAKIITPGEYSGTIDTPKDVDTFKIRLSEGDKLTMNMYVGRGAGRFQFATQLENPDGQKQVLINSSNLADITRTSNNYDDLFITPQETFQANVEVIAEQDGIACYRAFESGEWETPYNWQIGFSINNPTAPSPPIAELQNSVDQLQNKLDEKNQTITELQSQLDEKNQTITELQSQIETYQSQVEKKNQTIAELRSELENTTKPINVTVEPAGSAAEFQSGGEAVVTASGAPSVLTELTVSYAGKTKIIGEDGRARISLAQSGDHQMNFSYLDSESSITLSVEGQQQSNESVTQSDSTDGTDGDMTAQGTDGDGTENSGASAPGFGAGIAVTAVITLTLLLIVGHLSKP